MSLIVTVTTGEGVVMASDSRCTYTRTEKTNDGNQIVNIGTLLTDTTYKTFLCGGVVGISTCGAASVCKKSIASHIEEFINNVYNKNDTLGKVALKLKTYFETMPHSDCVRFHVAGYEKKGEQDCARVYEVLTNPAEVKLLSDGVCGANWAGVAGVLTRLIKNGYTVPEGSELWPQEVSAKFDTPDGEKQITFGDEKILIPRSSVLNAEMHVDWDLLTLQDGIDFAKYAITTTIETMRFQSVPKTVGGPIDILVLKPGTSKWIAHKELHP